MMLEIAGGILIAVLMLPSLGWAKNKAQSKQSLRTYLELRDARALPKWATTVCFMEYGSNSKMEMQESQWNEKDESATEFMVYGPKGHLGIQTEEYIEGRDLAYAKWERQNNSPGSSNFTSLILDKKHHYNVFMKLRLQWEPSQRFYIGLTDVNTGQPISKDEGRCHPITEAK